MKEEIRRLRKALKDKNTDNWAVGTVIRWTASGKYSYAAIKTPVGWYTSAAYNNGFVKTIETYDNLVEILARAETSDVEVATEWTAI